ncbi:T9SS type A sorting domain-containing protein [Sinomicrobium sp. M5D2P17]
MKKLILTSLTNIFCTVLLIAQDHIVVDKEVILNTATNKFHGIEYYRGSEGGFVNPYENDFVNSNLKDIGVDLVQIKVHLKDIAPINSNTNQVEYNFEVLDRDVELLNSKGYTAAIQIMPDRAWFPFQQYYIDNKDNGDFVYRQDENGQFDYGWWNYNYMNGLHTMSTWRKVIYNIANRYKDKNIRLIIFDEPCVYDDINITNCTNEEEFALTYDKAAEVYINAAQVVKGYDKLRHIKIGGFAGHKFQTSVLAKRIFDKDNNSYDNLDFIAMNIFLGKTNDYIRNGNNGILKEEKRFEVLNRTIQFEELASSTLDQNNGFAKELMVDSYNVFGSSGLTFPANRDHFGAIHQTLAQLHAFQGGIDVLLKWNVIGNSGVFSSGFGNNPINEKKPTYHAWRFIHDILELKENNSIVECRTQEDALTENVEHFTNNAYENHVQTKDAFKVQPFAILTQNGGINVALVNKYGSGQSRFIKIPSNMKFYETYKFINDENDTDYNNAFNIHNTGLINDEYSINVYCHPESITVIKFYADIPQNISKNNSDTLIDLNIDNTLLQVTSNNSVYNDVYIYNLNGVLLKNEKLNNNFNEINISELSAGLYIIKIITDDNTTLTKKILKNK